MTRKKVMFHRNFAGYLLLSASMLLTLASAQEQPQKPKSDRSKRVFTNDDLLRYKEQSVKTSTAPVNDGVSPSSENYPAPGPSKTDAEGWASKLQAADKNLELAKFGEAKYAASLDKYQIKLSEAKTEFQIRTTQAQVADCEKNLARAKQEVKKAEEEKRKLLAEAKKNGVDSDPKAPASQ
jgi:hypothetical protein